MGEALIRVLLDMLLGKGGEDMMAMLWAQQIMLGKRTFDQVPKLLREKVRELLEDSGASELVQA